MDADGAAMSVNVNRCAECSAQRPRVPVPARLSRRLLVCSSVEDPFYRYKMPALIAKVEGRGNGIKTVIPNMGAIARALARPPDCTSFSTTTRARVLCLECHGMGQEGLPRAAMRAPAGAGQPSARRLHA